MAADTLELWRAALLREGYSPGTANTHVSAANGLLAYLGRRDLQLIGQLDTEEEIQPELSRTGHSPESGPGAYVSDGEGLCPDRDPRK